MHLYWRQAFPGVRTPPLLLALPLALAVPASSQSAAPLPAYDVVVVGGSPGGLTAAVAAARAGRAVGVFEPSGHLGGVVAGGLTASDVGRAHTIGGLSREFYSRTRDHYRETYGSGSPEARACNNGYWFEPHVGEQAFWDMVRSTGQVDVFLRHQLLAVEREGPRVARLEMRNEESGETLLVAARVFIDALYEGDLLALAGVPYRVGREGRHEYGEPHAGTGPGEQEPPGAADLLTQAYNYRLCLTDDPENQASVTSPEGYRREDYLTLEAYLRANEGADFTDDCVSAVPMPRRKTDANNGPAWQSTDFVGGNHDYWRVTVTDRRAIAEAHRRYILGMLHFLRTDPAVPDRVRQQAQSWAPARDEFVDNAHWPYALYVRECRRMVGRHVFTEWDATRDIHKPDSTGLGSYSIDSHAVRRLARPDGAYRAAGGLFVPTQPYEIPYGVVCPQEIENLLVPVCCSATHVGYCTLRMEPVYMILGHACGEAAAMACETGVRVQDIDTTLLQQRLVAAGQVIRANRPPVADFRLPSPTPLQAGTPVSFESTATDGDGKIVSWQWDLDGDGETDSAEPNPTFTFTLSRSYSVTLIVRDDKGAVSLPCTKTAEVVGGPPGIADLLIDNPQAQLTGQWITSASSPGFVGLDYLHDGNRNQGALAARYAVPIETPGLYDVAVSWPPYANRATNAPVRIRHADGEATVTVDQREAPHSPPFRTLGRYRFTPESGATVEVGNAGTDGFVIADAVRLRYQGPAGGPGR